MSPMTYRPGMALKSWSSACMLSSIWMQMCIRDRAAAGHQQGRSVPGERGAGKPGRAAAQVHHQPGVLNDIGNALCRFFAENGIQPYNEETGRGLVRHIFLRRGAHSGQTVSYTHLDVYKRQLLGPNLDVLLNALS